MIAVTFTAENINGLQMTGFSDVESFDTRASELLSELKDGETLTLEVSYETAKEIVKEYGCSGCMAAHIAAQEKEKSIPLDIDHEKEILEAAAEKSMSLELACLSGEAYL